MKQTFYLLALTLLTITKSMGQVMDESFYNSLALNKSKSIFQTVDNGTFSGITNGYIQLKNGKDTLVLDFQISKTTLAVIHDPQEMYDKSTKKYSTQTTSGKTVLNYDIYALANILAINLNGFTYSIGVIDGAADMPILGLNFNYCADNKTEFLTLFVIKPLELTATRDLIRQKNITYTEAQKLAKTITVLPGSTLILTINK